MSSHTSIPCCHRPPSTTDRMQAGDVGPDMIERLTPRQRDCLKLVHAGYETKEIAKELSIGPDRVNKLIGEAMKRLGVSRRTTAARLIAEYEAGVRPRISPAQSMGAHPMGVSRQTPPDEDDPAYTANAGRTIEDLLLRDTQAPYGAARSSLGDLPLPFRSAGRVTNDLTLKSTLISIGVIAILCAGAAGSALSLLLVVNLLVSEFPNSLL